MGFISFIKRFFNKDEGITVVSLFDGISCGQVALNRVGINVKNYYAFEIDKYAIQVTQKNYPNTIQMGSVVNADFKQFRGKVDLLIGGSSCQNLSIAGNRKGLQGDESKLFFEYLRALQEIKPKYFLLENNASMTKENKDLISQYMGCQPILINSELVSAQVRKRLYWTNIPNIEQPKNQNKFLKDIVQPREDKRDFECTERFKAKKVGTLAHKKAHGGVRTLEQKSKTLTCGQQISNSGATTIKYGEDSYYIPTPLECERLQTLPDNYTEGLSKTQRYKCIGNGWTVDVIAHIFKHYKKAVNNGK